jgi:hypothetical protein
MVMAMSLQQCSCSDVVGSLFVSEQDEVRIGAEFHKQLQDSTRTYPIYKANTEAKKKYRAYAESVFVSVLDKAKEEENKGDGFPGYPIVGQEADDAQGRRSLRYQGFTFTLIDQPIINAFAVPGGYVYLYTGILDSMRSESELAGVIGHEIAHVTHHHYRNQMAKLTGIQILLDALVGDQGELTKAVANMFAGLASLKLSREHESEADEYGTIYLGRTERHPEGIADFFARMPTSLDWFQTHPASDTRVTDVKTQVKNTAWMSVLLAKGDTIKYIPRFKTNTALK